MYGHSKYKISKLFFLLFTYRINHSYKSIIHVSDLAALKKSFFPVSASVVPLLPRLLLQHLSHLYRCRDFFPPQTNLLRRLHCLTGTIFFVLFYVLPWSLRSRSLPANGFIGEWREYVKENRKLMITILLCLFIFWGENLQGFTLIVWSWCLGH